MHRDECRCAVAKIILDCAAACFERSPILKQLIASRTADALELTNGITLEVRPASIRWSDSRSRPKLVPTGEFDGPRTGRLNHQRITMESRLR